METTTNTPSSPAPTTAQYYHINEDAARRAKESMSFSDYVPGSATAEYRQMVDKAVEVVEKQKRRVDPEYHQRQQTQRLNELVAGQQAIQNQLRFTNMMQALNFIKLDNIANSYYY